MREISKEYLENVENEYLNNVGCTITRRALVKNKISDLTRVNEQTEFTRDMFSINLKTLPVTNQKQRSPGNRTSFLYYIENKIGLDKTDKDLYNILACIRLHCLK